MPSCSFCPGRHFVDEQALNQHTKATPSHRLCCWICNREFSSPTGLEQHRSSKHRQNYRCDICGREFASSQSLEQHAEDKHTPTYDCDICDREFSSQQALESHTNAKHPPTYDCDICDREFSSPQALESHTNAKHPPTYDCDNCDRRFSSPQALENHIKDKHPTYDCDICDREFSSAEALEQHTNAKHPTYDCDICDCEFSSQLALENHTKDIHTPTYDCDICDREFSSPQALESHTNAKHPTYDCDICDYEFSSPQSLEDHIKTEHSTHDCDVCDREFSSSTALEQHKSAKHPKPIWSFSPGESSRRYSPTSSNEVEEYPALPNYLRDNCEETFGLPEAHKNIDHRVPESSDCAAPRSHQICTRGSIPPCSCATCKCSGVSPEPQQPQTPLDEFRSISVESDIDKDSHEHAEKSKHEVEDTETLEPGVIPSVASNTRVDAAYPSVDLQHRCAQCEEDFARDEELEKHYLDAPDAVHPTCLRCECGFASVVSFHSHLETAHAILSCDVCHVRVGDTKDLEGHYLVSTNHCRCMRCVIGFKDQEALDEHESAAHPNADIQSDSVGQWTDTETWMLREGYLQDLPAEDMTDATLVGDPGAGIEQVDYLGTETTNVASNVDATEDLTRVVELRLSDSQSGSIPDPEAGSDTASAQEWSEEGNDGNSHLGADENIPESEHAVDSPPESLTTTPVSHNNPLPLDQMDSENHVYHSTTPSPTPSEHGSVTYAPLRVGNQVNGISRGPSPQRSQESEDGFYYVSPPTSPLLSAGSEILVSADAIPRYVRDNRAYLVATSARTRSRSQSRSRSGTSTPLLLSSVASSIESLPLPTQQMARVAVDPSSDCAPSFHCRICHKDPCDDLTATMCGHLFCNRCITGEIMAKSACPVCQKPTLLYCLFKIDATT
ncbi:hypothetical protein BJ138DRAFT_485650 [Hygrophoropsis aurantiaca]|uniref:Uncharacterized protein n=1 Tax=Hygrophoropsis aurantiaca TaxID=72124 RepID=A0ACB8A2M6_9AGAM|nr:hypothetical protein BJ138DRAFT_485650 [Hygrophoropsis aurantiaca]